MLIESTLTSFLPLRRAAMDDCVTQPIWVQALAQAFLAASERRDA